jgi:hypothetical protein
VKKNPEIQKFGGAPLSIHDCMNFNLSRQSSTHEARGLRDGYALLAHTAGTMLL